MHEMLKQIEFLLFKQKPYDMNYIHHRNLKILMKYKAQELPQLQDNVSQNHVSQQERPWLPKHYSILNKSRNPYKPYYQIKFQR